MSLLIRKFSPKEGMIVDYKGTAYWICEVRGERVRLLPMEAISFDEDHVYDLSKAFEVALKTIKPFEAG